MQHTVLSISYTFISRDCGATRRHLFAITISLPSRRARFASALLCNVFIRDRYFMCGKRIPFEGPSRTALAHINTLYLGSISRALWGWEKQKDPAVFNDAGLFLFSRCKLGAWALFRVLGLLKALRLTPGDGGRGEAFPLWKFFFFSSFQ